jgi:hypothetical protein
MAWIELEPHLLDGSFQLGMASPVMERDTHAEPQASGAPP